MTDNKMILVKVEQLILSNVGFALLLKGVHDPRTLPIVIGGAESQSIAICLNNLQTPRPLTHDLMKNILDFLECRLMRVELSELKEGTFYARLILDRDGSRMDLDARPSDSIALALRVKAPIFVAPQVMDEAGQIFSDPGKSGEASADGSGPESVKEKYRTPIETLQANLDKAVAEERYEDAAKIRDEIERVKKTLGDN